MAAYPTLSKSDLATFSGRAEATYGDYADQALKEATLFFKRNTCLAALPDGEEEQELAKFAILSLADQLVLIQPHQETLVSPLASEVIGSYSYSLKQNLQQRQPTGLMWFDLAVTDLGVCDAKDDSAWGGGLEVFEYDLPRIQGHLENNEQVVSPGDLAKVDGVVFHDPSARIL